MGFVGLCMVVQGSARLLGRFSPEHFGASFMPAACAAPSAAVRCMGLTAVPCRVCVPGCVGAGRGMLSGGQLVSMQAAFAARVTACCKPPGRVVRFLVRLLVGLLRVSRNLPVPSCLGAAVVWLHWMTRCRVDCCLGAAGKCCLAAHTQQCCAHDIWHEHCCIQQRIGLL